MIMAIVICTYIEVKVLYRLLLDTFCRMPTFHACMCRVRMCVRVRTIVNCIVVLGIVK